MLKQIESKINDNQNLVFSSFFVLVLIVFLHQMGALALFADEPTRSNVALEMILSGNYWVPTISGEFYYRKPPLYNWIIALIYNTTGSYSEFVFRLPSIVPLAVYGYSIYAFFKNKLGVETAFFGAAGFVLSGRFLVYAGLLGHIDIFYSWVTFMAFCIQIRAYQEQKWWSFFIWPYLLHSICFLMKGLPSFLFAGVTPVAILFFYKQWKRIVDYRHFIGMVVFLIPLVAYFWKYSQYNDLMGWVDQLWDQSSQRTVVNNSIWKSIGHLFTFPFDQFGHLAPVFIFFPLVFFRKVRRAIWTNKWWQLCIVVLVANIPPYWLSPGYYPRYLFMLYPFMTLLAAKAYFDLKDGKIVMIIEKFFAFVFLAAPLLILILPLVVRPELVIDYMWLKLILIAVLLFIMGYLLLKVKAYGYLFLMGGLLVFKIYFNWFVIEDRIQFGKANYYKEQVLSVINNYKDKNLYVWGKSAINHDAIFYIESSLERILEQKLDIPTGDYVIVAPNREKAFLKNHIGEVVDSFVIRYREMELKIYKVTAKISLDKKAGL